MADKKQIQPLLRAASFVPSSFNEADNTIDLVASTESEVLQRTWEHGSIKEILGHSVGQVRLDRLNANASVLDNHNSYGSVRQTVLGVVVEARLEKKQLVVKVRLSSREELKDFIADVRNGIFNNISIGYRVYKYEITEEEGQIPVYRATDWEPFEVSFVAVPADYNAGTRSQKDIATHEVELIRNSNSNNMKRSSEILKLVRAAGVSIDFAQTLIDDESITIESARSMIEAEKARTAGAPAPAAPADPVKPAQPPVDGEATRAAVTAERKRSSEILNAVRAAKLSADFAQELIDNDSLTVDQARAAIIAKMASDPTQTQNSRAASASTIVLGADETDKRRTAMIDGIVLRSGQVKPAEFKPEQVSSAREFRSLSLLEIAKDCLIRAGVSVAGLDKMAIAARAMSSTSDFPVLLEGTTRRVLLANYTSVADTWRRFCAVGSVSDFRQHKRLRMGSFTKLDQVGENSEFKNKKITDADSESASIETYGNIINISRKMIVNDDLNGFARLANMLGRAAARSIEIDVYALLASNPALSDGIALFHASHNNLLTSGAAPNVAQFEAMRVKMAQQKDKDNNDFLDLRPSIWVGGIANGGEARVTNDAQYDTDTANKLQKPNKVRGLFKDIVDTARITGTEHYAFADPNEEPVLEVNFLDGVETPFLDSEEEFKTDGMAWKVRLDYGVDAIGFRGAVKNPGA